MSQPRGQVPVAVVGAGPAGATAANLLGCYGVETLVIDRDRGIVDYPRAIGIDDESVRVLQTAGLAGEIMADAIQNVPLKFFGSSGRCFASVQPSVREFGWYKRNIFLQPLAEAALRRGLGRFPHVQTWFGTELTGLDQGEDGVTLHLAGRDPVQARYVIAADGGRSGIRHHLGITLDGDTQPRQWVVIDCAADPVDAPWTGLHCDPRRPYVSARLPYGHRRWEFMLHPGEDGESPAKVTELLGYHLPDPASAGVVRTRVYTHHARLARTFVAGRVALAGDAAHLMPPWAGQGMNTGIRDAANLAWKLAAIVRGQAGHGLLASYDQERRPHAKAMIDLSVMLGRVLSPAHRPVALARDQLLRAASLVPGAADWITQMRFKPRPRYRDGFFTVLMPAPCSSSRWWRTAVVSGCGSTRRWGTGSPSSATAAIRSPASIRQGGHWSNCSAPGWSRSSNHARVTPAATADAPACASSRTPTISCAAGSRPGAGTSPCSGQTGMSPRSRHSGNSARRWRTWNPTRV